MASKTAADGTGDTGRDDETLEQVEQRPEDNQNRLEDINDRLEDLTERIDRCDGILADLKLLRAMLQRR